MQSEKDISQFSEACIEFYRPGLTLGNYASRGYRFLEALVPAEFIAFGSLDLKTSELSIGLNQSVPQFPAAMEAFGQLMGSYDLFCWDPTVNSGKPFCRSDFFSERQFRNLDVYSEVYQRIGIDNHCAVHVPTNAAEIAFFGIERLGGPDFSSRDRQMMEIAQSHLANARNLVWAQAEMAECGSEPEHLVPYGLSSREAEVLAWLAEGKSNEEIAILLGLRLYTIKDYLKSVFQKIGAHNRLEAALWAIRTSKRHQLLYNAKATIRVPSTGGQRPTPLDELDGK